MRGTYAYNLLISGAIRYFDGDKIGQKPMVTIIVRQLTPKDISG